jgi:hypothetical protein
MDPWDNIAVVPPPARNSTHRWKSRGETALIPQIILSPSLTGLDFAIKLTDDNMPFNRPHSINLMHDSET